MTSPALALVTDVAPPTLDALYRRYAPAVLRRVRRFFPGDEAEDVVHEVFLRAMEHLDGFRGQASPMTWLYRLATNHCLNRLRDATRRRELLAEEAPVIRTRFVQDPDQESRAFLAGFWASLDPELAEIGTYYYVDDMTQAEIGRLMGVTGRTIGNRLDALRVHARAAAGLPTEAPR